MRGKMQVGEVLLIHHEKHGHTAALLEPLCHGIDAIGTHPIAIENKEVEIMRHGRRIWGRNMHLDT